MTNTLQKLRYGVVGCWYFVIGHLIAAIHYDTKYLTGRWFSGKLHGLCSSGWRWVVSDSINCARQNVNRDAKFPVSSSNRVICPENIVFDADDLNNFQSFGIYFQAIGRIEIGKGTYIGPNVGLITANHDPNNLDNHLGAEPIRIGEKCWLGMNSVILPGVTLGNNTIVGAGAVVTKSFENGNCIVAGNPAKVIKYL